MKYERLNEEERKRIIVAVNASGLPVAKALKCLGIPRSTYYNWLRKAPKKPNKLMPRKAWNRLLPSEAEKVISHALEMPGLFPRDLSYTITDLGAFSVSESSVYRILKSEGLVKTSVVIVAKAAKEYPRKTERVHEMWATDFMYMKVIGWGWYYVGGLLDDQSRYLICYDVHKDMDAGACSDILQLGLERTGLIRVSAADRNLKLLSDNGSGYLSDQFNEFLKEHGVNHIYTAPRHPQSNGKIERLNETAKEHLMHTVFRSPEKLQSMLEDFRYWYNYVHCHESLCNLRPADIYNGRGDDILKARKVLKKETLKRRRELNLSDKPECHI